MVDSGFDNHPNMALVRMLLLEGYGKGNVSILPALLAPGFIGRLAIGEHYGPEGIRIDIAGYRSHIQDLVVTIDDMGAYGDRVVCRFTFRGLTRDRQEPVELNGIAINRCDEGRLVESWTCVTPVPPS